MVRAVVTKKITITLPEEYLEQAKQLAEEAGLPLSTWIAQTVEHETRIQAGLAAMREWEAEHGAFTEEELAQAHAELAKADAELRTAKAPIMPGRVA
jgi:cytosine/adenosine deaminase-related metal-dependent hydrolase